MILDVGNGLGAQDPVIAEIATPRKLIALNLTMSQLHAGAPALAQAGAVPVRADAARIPLASASVDGVISVEAAFHFSSRLAFLCEARRVLKPGGVLTMSDVPVIRYPRTPLELYAGLVQMRVWAIRFCSAATARDIVSQVELAGFEDVHIELCGERVIDPALRLLRGDLRRRTMLHLGTASPRGSDFIRSRSCAATISSTTCCCVVPQRDPTGEALPNDQDRRSDLHQSEELLGVPDVHADASM